MDPGGVREKKREISNQETTYTKGSNRRTNRKQRRKSVPTGVTRKQAGPWKMNTKSRKKFQKEELGQQSFKNGKDYIIYQKRGQPSKWLDMVVQVYRSENIKSEMMNKDGVRGV